MTPLVRNSSILLAVLGPIPGSFFRALGNLLARGDGYGRFGERGGCLRVGGTLHAFAELVLKIRELLKGECETVVRLVCFKPSGVFTWQATTMFFATPNSASAYKTLKRLKTSGRADRMQA